MENFNLSDEEQRKFSEYFSALDIDKQAKLSFKCVRHFLSAYRLGEDDLEKIFTICGAKRLGHFNRSQFFVALRLVALAQNSYELSLENLGKANLPLPRRLSTSFSPHDACDAKPKPKYEPHLQPNSLDSFSPAGIILPPPPSSASKSKSSRLKNKRSPSSQICRFCNRHLINTTAGDTSEQADHLRSFVLVCSNCKRSNQSGGLDSPTAAAGSNSTTNPTSEPNSSSDNSRCSSTELYETIDNSLAFEKLKTWEKIESNQARDVGVDSADESKHCLLNDDEEAADTNNKLCLNIGDEYASKYESVGYESSGFAAINRIEEENDEDVWSMNDEQVKFYFDKFCRLLPSRADRKLAGSSVKSFFEKSKLSLNDLMKIWTLSDLDSDGSLTLIEFCIAMHLVVLKRNEVPLPDQLPHSLSPGRIKLLLASNKLQAPQSPDATFAGFRETSKEQSYGSITDSSSGSLPSYHQVSINVSSDNISSNNLNVSSQPRNSFDSDYYRSVDHHANQSSNPPAHLRNQQADTSHTTAASSLLMLGHSGTLSGGSMSSASIGEHDATIILYSPNREWTKFNNSPFTTGRQPANGNQHDHQNNHSNQTNPLAADGPYDANGLMAPANFDKIELDPLIPHPMPVKVSSGGSQPAGSTLVNKDRVASLNPPAYPARPRAGGHARSSSLDLTRKMVNFNSANIAQHQGAFVTYRRHLQQQQQQSYRNPPSFDKPNGQPAADKAYYLQLLKAKYALPKQAASTGDLVSALKERNFLVERIFEVLIDDFAGTLEQLSKLSEKS